MTDIFQVKNRSVGSLDFLLSTLVGTLNSMFVRVKGWKQLVKGFTVELRGFPVSDLDGCQHIYAYLHPTEWPSDSFIAVRIKIFPNKTWELDEGTFLDHHLDIGGQELHQVQFVITRVCGFLIIRINESGEPRVAKILADAISERTPRGLSLFQ